ncbi:CU044_2847 family protein [Micromonospora sp. SL1-18]|uniref:CU044_2847 family protein n=1 Tax=Micromonospora sp. SL1-18 TaxID=3399128 RepID=UPI003A4E05C8
MTQLARFDLDGGGSVLVEVDEKKGVQPAGKPGKLIQDAGLSFANALTDVRDAASAALDKFRGMVHEPDEVEIKFSVQLDAEVGAIIARTGISGNLEVTVKWGRPDAERAGGATPST